MDIKGFYKRYKVRKKFKKLKEQTEWILKHRTEKLTEEQIQKSSEFLNKLQEILSSNDWHKFKTEFDKFSDFFERNLNKYKKGVIRENIESIIWAASIALILRSFVIEAYKIPSGSMIPTLVIGDHLFVNKYIYGLKIPFTFIKFFDYRKPKRGEIVIFTRPEEGKDFIKRVIGVEGDTVEVRGHDIYLNGELLKKEYVDEYEYFEKDEFSGEYKKVRAQRYLETIDGKKHYIILKPDSPLMGFGDGIYKIEKDALFVMGDNRDNSSDSRFWGTVKLKQIKGRAMFIWWSWGGGKGIQFNRIFKWIE
ncbi:MAG: signal peptidase I [Deltaproteobacteria bacterium]|nr:signal peptidase I [Deltaproteobacteria bacterium]